MPHETNLISTLVVALVLSFILGAIANRFRQPPLVGYLLAGVLVGPHTPGFIADIGLAQQLAEIGVILLMFGVGLNFTLRDFLTVRSIALSGAIAQMAVATLLGWGLGVLMGWSSGAGLIFGLALSVASTVVLLKWLQDRHLTETEGGKIAIGWLIVEDLAMVLALVLIPAAARIADGGDVVRDPLTARIALQLGLTPDIGFVIAVTLLKVVAFIVLMLIIGRRLIPELLHRVAHSGSRELFRLSVLAVALGMAFGAAQLFGVSLALGAFFAGMVLSESKLSSRAAQESLPLRDAFAVLFFVSVGMLFDPATILSDPLPALATVLIIIIGRSVVVFATVIAFRHTVSTALFLATSRAQIGEFSFILAELGVALGILPREAQALILVGAITSIILNPAMMYAGEFLRRPVERWLGAEPPAPKIEASEQPAREKIEASSGSGPPPQAASAPGGEASEQAIASAEPSPEVDELAADTPSTLSDHTVLIGFGRVGSVIGDGFDRAGTKYLVIEAAEAPVAALRERGTEAFVGNAAGSNVLGLANLAHANTLVIAIPDAFEAGQVTEQARRANPSIRIVARAHSDAEAEHLASLGADIVVLAEREVARGMLECLSLDRGASAVDVQSESAAGPDGKGADGKGADGL